MPFLVGPLVNHLWQSTVFAAVVWIVSLALRRNQARTRYWIWLAASMKFLVPFSLLVSAGGRVDRQAIQTPPLTATAVHQISTSFEPVAALPAARSSISWWPEALFAVWIAGVLVLAIRWFRNWLYLHRAARNAARLSVAMPVIVAASPLPVEPGIFGIFKPVLLVPAGIMNNLTPEQFEAILAHELCHVRYRDNLTSALHMVVEAVFWFHPAVWWIGAKLMDERERACDEAVVEQGNQPQVYAQGILNVCRFYLESPLPCTAGVTGADLKARVREILHPKALQSLSAARKLMLVATGIAAVALPVVIGRLRAQTLPPPPEHSYEVVSIRPAPPGEPNSRIGPGPQGGMRAQNTTIMQLLTFAYDVRDYQFSNVPGWVQSDRFDVQFTPDKPEVQLAPGMSYHQMEGMFNRQRQRMQAILRDRFSLVLRAETKEMPVYALKVGKNGHKLKPTGSETGPHVRSGRRQISATGGYMRMVIGTLSNLLGRPVLDETGLDGPYDFKVEWTDESSIQMPGRPDAPPPPAEGGISIFTAIEDQLGLRLEGKKGPVTVYVIEKIEKPQEN